MQHIEGTEMYRLLKPLVYITWKGVRLAPPKGYPSDGHSIPKLLRSLAGCPIR